MTNITEILATLDEKYLVYTSATPKDREWLLEGAYLRSALQKHYPALRDEIRRLNELADGMTDRAMEERRTGEEGMSSYNATRCAEDIISMLEERQYDEPLPSEILSRLMTLALELGGNPQTIPTLTPAGVCLYLLALIVARNPV